MLCIMPFGDDRDMVSHCCIMCCVWVVIKGIQVAFHSPVMSAYGSRRLFS